MDLVSFAKHGDVARVEFGDPATRNLLTVPLLVALPVALDTAVRAGARVVVLQGRGDIWSGGYDITQIPADLFAADPKAALDHPFERCMRAVADCALPTIAAIHGHAIGGALELALACDLRLAVAGARFGITAAKLGLVYPQSGLERLWRIVGPAVARRLLFSAEIVDAREAERLGIVHRVVERPEFDPAVASLARELAAAAPLAIQGMKRILRLVERGTPPTEAEVLEILRLRQASFESQDFVEGRAAFAAKRQPRFEGR